MLTQDGLDKLLKLIGYFGSAHDGEAANAARLADKQVKAMGIDWRELLTPKVQKPTINVNVGGKPVNGAQPQQPQQPQAAPQSNSTRQRTYQRGGTPRGAYMATHLPQYRGRDVARDILANYQYMLTAWELKFCQDTSTGVQGPYLSLRQLKSLQEIAVKVGVTI